MTDKYGLTPFGIGVIIALFAVAAAIGIELGVARESADREASCQSICQARSVLPGRVTHYGCLCGDGSLTPEPEHHDTTVITQPVYVPAAH